MRYQNQIIKKDLNNFPTYLLTSYKFIKEHKAAAAKKNDTNNNGLLHNNKIIKETFWRILSKLAMEAQREKKHISNVIFIIIVITSECVVSWVYIILFL